MLKDEREKKIKLKNKKKNYSNQSSLTYQIHDSSYEIWITP
jgi:hypothetical protein